MLAQRAAQLNYRTKCVRTFKSECKNTLFFILQNFFSLFPDFFFKYEYLTIFLSVPLCLGGLCRRLASRNEHHYVGGYFLQNIGFDLKTLVALQPQKLQ